MKLNYQTLASMIRKTFDVNVSINENGNATDILIISNSVHNLYKLIVSIFTVDSYMFSNMYLLPLPLPIKVTPSFSISAISFLTCCAVLPVIWRIS